MMGQGSGFRVLVCALAVEPLENLGFQALSLELQGKVWFLQFTWFAPIFYISSPEPLSDTLSPATGSLRDRTRRGPYRGCRMEEQVSGWKM